MRTLLGKQGLLIPFFGFAAAGTILAYLAHPATGWVKLAATTTAAILCGVSLAPPSRMRVFLFSGMLVAIAGDYFLGVPPIAFLSGLAAFLVSYLLFAIGLMGFAVYRRSSMVFLLVSIAAGAAQLLVMRRLPPDLLVPVIAYACMQVFLVFAGFSAYLGMGGSRRGRALFAGAILLYLSDSSIGHNMFTAPIGRFYQPIVLIPYYAGLALLMIGTLFLRDRPNDTGSREKR
jgi:uncharacterized membrane protein YhhN